MTARKTFVISRGEPISEALYGHAFDRSDLVFGSRGKAEFEDATQRSLQIGLDGSYVLVSRAGDTGFHVGTDFNGHGKIFLYRCGGDWAVSNSFMELAHHAANRRWPVTLDDAHLASFFLPKALGAQLLSLRTAIREITLLPSFMGLAIDGADIRTVNLSAQAHDGPTTYPQALAEFVGQWVSRICTLLQSDGRVVCDLTGGLDSRTSFSILLAADRVLGNGALGGVHINSNSSSPEDFDIAQKIVARLNLRLNDPPNPFGQGYRKAAPESYHIWKATMLGTYAPLFWPVATDGKKLFWVGGEGGESNRQFFKASKGEELLSPCKSLPNREALGEVLFSEALADLKHMMGRDDVVDPAILHYRQFRERFHGARRSAFAQSICPLASVFAKRAADTAPVQAMRDGQFLRDVMANAAPEVLEEAFDNKNHAFGAVVAASAEKLGDWLSAVRTDGRVFGFDRPDPKIKPFRTRECFDLLRSDFNRHLAAATDLGFFTQQELGQAEEQLRSAAEQGGRLDPNKARAVTHVLLAGMLAEIATGRRR